MADTMNDMNDDNVQHGIDDNPHDDGKKGLELGALGGGTVGAIAGMAAGPIGAIVGAIVGGTAGSLASGAAVDAVDAIDNDNTVTGIGIGSGATRDVENTSGVTSEQLHTHGSGVTSERLHAGNDVPGVQTGGVTTAGADTRGIMEKTADAITGDRTDDKTGGQVLGDDTLSGTTGAMGATGIMGATGTMGDTIRDGATKVQLAAEELHVDKARQQAGEVEIHKEVVEEQVEIPVTLQHEEVVITRHAVNRDLAPGERVADMNEDEVVRIPVTQEVANVTKTAHVVEEVEVGKRVVSEDQTVSGTVRHEEIDINDTTKHNR